MSVARPVAALDRNSSPCSIEIKERGFGRTPIPAHLMTSRDGSEQTKKPANYTIPLLPLRDVIIVPHMVVPLFVGLEKSINALEEAVTKKLDLFLVAQKQAGTVNPTEKDIYTVGTIGTILQILKLPDN